MFFIQYTVVPLLILWDSTTCCEHQETLHNNVKRTVRNPVIPYRSNSYDKGWVAKDWLKEDHHLGQVSGVALDDDGFVYVFHRSNRVWNTNTFNNVNNEFLQTNLGPIVNPTILIFHSNGTLLEARGKGMFYMPHGIFVDKYKNIWVTDVALHQVMKLPPNSDNPLLTLGKAFTPGKDIAHFCKPTSVSVLRETDDFFVADGYCNFRILKFSSKGVKLLEWGRSSATANGRIPGHYEFFIPHALTVVEEKGFICVADRENGRVLCFNTNNGTFILEISNQSVIGSRIYSVSYSPANGGQFILINGVVPFLNSAQNVQGSVVSSEGQIESQFGLNFLQLPHDVAVSNDSHTIYVAELSPPRISKFIFDNDEENIKINESSFPHIEKIIGGSEEGQLTGAILVTSSCLIFATVIIVAAFIYSRSKKAGPYETTESLLGNQEL